MRGCDAWETSSDGGCDQGTTSLTRRLIESPHARGDQRDDQHTRGAASNLEACDSCAHLFGGMPVDQCVVAENQRLGRGARIEPLQPVRRARCRLPSVSIELTPQRNAEAGLRRLQQDNRAMAHVRAPAATSKNSPSGRTPWAISSWDQPSTS